MKYCLYCGEWNSDESQICIKCQKPFPNMEGTPEPAQPTQNFENTSPVQNSQNMTVFKYCQKCGTKCTSQAVICPNCWTPFQNKKNYAGQNNKSIIPLPLKVISFLIPLIGLIFYIVYIDKKPLRAKECGKMACIGFGVGVVLKLLSQLIYIF